MNRYLYFSSLNFETMKVYSWISA